MSNHDPQETHRQILGMRHRLIHGYDALDYDIVWAVIERELEPLARQVEAIVLAEFPPPAPTSADRSPPDPR